MDTTKQDNRRTIDYLILGSGPAGLQMAYYLDRAGRDYLVLEATEQAGSFFKLYPRIGSLISINKIHSIYSDPEVQLRWDWNSLLTDDNSQLFRDTSRRYFPKAEEMVRYLGDFARRYVRNIRFGVRVVRVDKPQPERFELEDDQGRRYFTRRLLVATGMGVPFLPDIAGIELVEGYEDVSMDPEDFVGQRVLILGKGNSGLEIANNLLETASLIHVASPEPVQLAWNTKHPGHVRAQQAIFLDTYQLKTLNSLLDCKVERIAKRDGRFVVSVSYSHAGGEREDLLYDRVIRCTGFRFDASIFAERIRPRLVISGRMPEITSGWECVGVPDMYMIGTLMQSRDFRRSASAFIDGFRYNIRTLHHLLEARYHGRELPGRELSDDAETLTGEIIERINWSSALWTQFGYLCDVIVVDEKRHRARSYIDLPVDYVHDSPLGRGEHYYTVTLEWGQQKFPDVFAIPRVPVPDKASRSAFLHPIVRRYAGPELVAEHHVLEDLFGIWRDEDAHVRPLRRFLERFAPQCQPATVAVLTSAGEGEP